MPINATRVVSPRIPPPAFAQWGVGNNNSFMFDLERASSGERSEGESITALPRVEEREMGTGTEGIWKTSHIVVENTRRV